MRLLRRRNAYAAVAAAVLISSVTVSGAASASGNNRTTLSGSVPSWARASQALGSVSDSTKLSFEVVLPMRNAADAAAVADRVADPSSSDYGHYLTPSQFNSRYAPTDAQVSDVKAYLKAQGFTVGAVAPGNRWVSASGATAAVNRAFGVTMRTYAYQGHRLKSPDKQISLPSSMKAQIATVIGLDDSGLLRRPANKQRVVASANRPTATTASAAAPAATEPPTTDCSDYWGEYSQTVPEAYAQTSFPTWICGYTPKQVRGAYHVDSTGLTGAGVTVAIIDAYGSPTMKADSNRYSRSLGEPVLGQGQYSEQLFTPFNEQGNGLTQCGTENDWNGEEAIDVESVHAMAPGASILYVGAQNCNEGLDDAMNWVIQNHAASIVSDSWGATGEVADSYYYTESALFLQAKAEGIGFYFSSGDDGDEYLAGNTDSPQPDWPASDANVTAVGGTSLAVNKSDGYKFETGWGTFTDQVKFGGQKAKYADPVPGEFWGGAGGGVSTLVSEPNYQKGVVPDSLATSRGGAPMRVVPDVAALADPYTGFAIGWSDGGVYQVETWGGTSLACPLFAGIQALASQHRVFPIGFANPLLYKAPASSYNDVRPLASTVAITPPSGDELVTFDLDSSLHTAPGYDDVTGRGSPFAPALVKAER